VLIVYQDGIWPPTAVIIDVNIDEVQIRVWAHLFYFAGLLDSYLLDSYLLDGLSVNGLGSTPL
jgi:hypothetical protein